MSGPVMEAVARRIAAIIPAEAIRHGWNVRDLQFDQTATKDRWSVGLVGPVEAETRMIEYVGGETFPVLNVWSGPHGRLEARTVDDLVRLVGEWIEAVWGKR